jgi:chromate transporter
LPTLREALPVWGKVATHSFGGPAGQIAVMHRVLVEERRWIGEERFLHALNFCMLLPGPEAMQLATYVGWLMHRTPGGLVAGGLFVLPGFLSILALSVLYAGFRDVGLVAALFFGLKPAVVAVVVEAVVRIGRRALRRPGSVWIAAAAFVAIFFFGVPFPLIVAGAALVGWALGRGQPAPPPAAPDGGGAYLVDLLPPPPRPGWRGTAATVAVWAAIWLVPVAALLLGLGPRHVFVEEAVFFSKAAMVTFGGAYSVLAYVAQQAVEVYGWLGPGEMLDGLGMAETTPGPLIQVVQFVGFMGAYRQPGGLDPMAAGVAGSVVTAWVTFAPCFLWVFAGAPHVEALRARRGLAAALAGVTAAVVGVVLNLAVWFALHTWFGTVAETTAGPLRLLVPAWGTLDPAALALTAVAFALLFGTKAGMLRTLAACAALGAAYRLLLG